MAAEHWMAGLPAPWPPALAPNAWLPLRLPCAPRFLWFADSPASRALNRPFKPATFREARNVLACDRRGGRSFPVATGGREVSAS